MDFILASTLLLSDTSERLLDTPIQETHSSTEELIETNRAIDSAQTLAQSEPICAPGQFPSAFPDVYPTDWAYQAVNRLSSRAVECFDLPSPVAESGEELR